MHSSVTPEVGVLISDLWDTIAGSPSNISARVLLMHQYVQLGWKSEALGMAEEILRLSPRNVDARQVKYGSESVNTTTEQERSHIQSAPSSQRDRNQVKKKAKGKRGIIRAPKSDAERATMEETFVTGIKQVQHIAEELHEDVVVVAQLLKNHGDAEFWKERIGDIRALADGRFSAVVDGDAPCSVRELARTIQDQAEHAVDLATDDFVNIVVWLRQEDLSSDGIRDRLVKRVRALEAALPKNFQSVAELGLMHAEHEGMDKTYVNEETMLGDHVNDIPRSKFWVSQDGYAWDMEELVDCLHAHSGVMRNPLSREMFSAEDVESIIDHPLGKKLGAAQIEQKRLANGVRPDTIAQMAILSAALLADQSADQAPSRVALDIFMQYMATLPKAEREALDKLRVPAVDSHTGQQFDASVGETVRDAIGNKTCAHKAGDLVGQAAKFLKK
jgi:hypothetical protein